MFKTYNHLIPVMGEVVLAATGTNSVLLMEHDVKKGRHGIKGQNWSSNTKDYSIWPRWNQPCQGGEMRKYIEVHGDECTRPESQKPKDLHNPFPEGNPVMVGNRFYTHVNKEHEYIFEHLYSKESPYRKGMASTRFVRDKWGRIAGVLIDDMKHVDPTVLVNGLQFTGYVINNAGSIHELVQNGATISEALMLLQLNSRGFTMPGNTCDYYFASKMDVRRFLDGDPNDLSGGSFYDRTDYNRKDVQDLFMQLDKEKALIWERDVKKEFAKCKHYFWHWKGDFMKEILPEVLTIIRTKYAQLSEEKKEAA